MQDFLPLFFQQILSTPPLEWIATITGFLCVYLAAKENILNWPISIISVGCYLFIFYQNKLYGDAFLQLYFLATAIYGWYYWSKKNDDEQKPIKTLGSIHWIYTIATILIFTSIIGWILDRFTDSDVPYIDAFCTSLSFTAQFLMSRKVLQNWLLWIVVDICYVPLYLHKELALTSILYILFLIIATQGFFSWRKKHRSQTKKIVGI